MLKSIVYLPWNSIGDKIHIKSTLNRCGLISFAETLPQFCFLRGIEMLEHFRTAKALSIQFHKKKLRVLKSKELLRKMDCEFITDALINNANRKTRRFLMKVMDAQFQSALWRHKDLLQTLIDCAMACQEFIFDCSMTDRDGDSCDICEICRTTSSTCFILAKSLIDNTGFTGQLLLQCAESCTECRNALSQFNRESSAKCISSCIRCSDASLALYRTIGMN